MKKFILVLIANLAFSGALLAQNPDDSDPKEGQVVVHRVEIGETVYLIAKKYKVRPQDIYELNPTAVEGVSKNMALRIPLDKQVETVKFNKKENDNFDLMKDIEKKKPVETPVAAQAEPVEPVGETVSTLEEIGEVSHKVTSGETLSGLAKKYGTTVSELEKANPKQLRHGLQSGQTLVIPGQSGVALTEQSSVPEVQTPAIAVTPSENTEHTVQSGETLLGLSRKYSTTVDAITSANPKVKRRGLQAGQTIIIPGTLAVSGQSEIVAAVGSESTAGTGIIEHKVQPGETLTGLARKYNTTISRISEDNKALLKRGLQAGQVLKVSQDSN